MHAFFFKGESARIVGTPPQVSRYTASVRCCYYSMSPFYLRRRAETVVSIGPVAINSTRER